MEPISTKTYNTKGVNPILFEWIRDLGEALPYGYKREDCVNYVKTTERISIENLKVGEVYVRPNGTAPVIVLENDRPRVHIRYFTGETDIISPVFMWKTDKLNKEGSLEACETTKGETEMEKLYQVKGTEIYAKHIATNSKGLYVLEVKGTGEVITKDKGDLEEVIPYTVSVSFFTDGMGNPREHSYFSKEGDVSVGDLVIINGSLAKVTGVGTKSTKATKELEGQVVLTKKIGE